MENETAKKVIETMMRTMHLCEIERDALTVALDALVSNEYHLRVINYKRQEIIDTVVGMLRNQPVIVRCKDCKHLLEHDTGELECEIKAGWFPVKPDWFCADGKRGS